MFAVLTAAGAFVVIPFFPAPITLQNLFTFLAGMVLGPAAGFLSQLTYITMGAAGLPVFAAGGSGIGYLMGPTGGYIIGFAPAAWVCGLFSRRGAVTAGMVVAMLIIYLFGVLQMKFVMELTFFQAFIIGAAPFIPGDILKMVVAYGIYRKLKSAGVVEE